MHELSITTDLVDAIVEKLEALEPVKVKRVVVEVGALTALLPDAMRFCFDLCAQGTVVQGAELEIVEMAGSELRLREVEVS